VRIGDSQEVPLAELVKSFKAAMRMKKRRASYALVRRGHDPA
jgi:hypothetical protein